MTNILFATAAIGEKYVNRCLETLKSFNKLDYDKNDELVIITDNVSAFKDIDLSLKVTILPYYLPKEWPVVNADNFRKNTIIKTIMVGDMLRKDNEHDLFVWYDCDAFIHKTKESMQVYEDITPGFYFKDAHEVEASIEGLKSHHLWERGERYLADINMYTSVWGVKEIDIYKRDEKYIFPIETNFIIKRDLNNPEWKVKECAFNNCASELVNFCLINYLDDNYGESFELNILISKSFNTMHQAPIIPAYCDLHIIPGNNTEKDKLAMQEDAMFQDFILK